MARLIDADAIALGIGEYLTTNAYLNDTAQSALEMVALWVCDAPTVDAVEVVHGEWLDGYAVDSNGKKVYDSIDCSVCEEVFKIESHDREYWKGRFKRCFCCGADMRERSEGE